MLTINFNGSPDRIYYCILFDEQNQTLAYNSGASTFTSFSQASTYEFSFLLTENANRDGFYSSMNFATLGNFQSTPRNLYVEIREKVGATFNYVDDYLAAQQSLVWNTSKYFGDNFNPTLEGTSFVGIHPYNTNINAQLRFMNEFGVSSTNTSGFNYSVTNPSGTLTTTGFMTYRAIEPFLNTLSDAYWNLSFLSSGLHYIPGSYIISVSGIYQQKWIRDNLYFTLANAMILATGIPVTISPGDSSILERMGYASGIINDAAPSTTVFTTTLPSATNDFYNGQIARVPSGAYAGQGRIISDYDGATKTITLNKAFGFTPVSGMPLVVNPLGGELNV